MGYRCRMGAAGTFKLGWLAKLALVCVVLLWAGCESYERPNRPLPADLTLRTLDGEELRREDLLGRPWVINVWVPG